MWFYLSINPCPCFGIRHIKEVGGIKASDDFGNFFVLMYGLRPSELPKLDLALQVTYNKHVLTMSEELLRSVEQWDDRRSVAKVAWDERKQGVLKPYKR